MNLYTRWNITRFIITFLSLMTGWVLFTWSLDGTALLAGVAACLMVSLLTYRVFVDEHEAARRAHFPRPDSLVLFLLVLVFNMYVASFRVLWNIVRGRINPGIVHFRTRLRTDIARVVLTNAITLTPGSITITLDDDHLIVHWLDMQTRHSRRAGELVKGTYEKLLRNVWQ